MRNYACVCFLSIRDLLEIYLRKNMAAFPRSEVLDFASCFERLVLIETLAGFPGNLPSSVLRCYL